MRTHRNARSREREHGHGERDRVGRRIAHEARYIRALARKAITRNEDAPTRRCSGAVTDRHDGQDEREVRIGGRVRVLCAPCHDVVTQYGG